MVQNTTWIRTRTTKLQAMIFIFVASRIRWKFQDIIKRLYWPVVKAMVSRQSNVLYYRWMQICHDYTSCSKQSYQKLIENLQPKMQAGAGYFTDIHDILLHVSVTKCIFQDGDDELHMLSEVGFLWMQCKKSSTNPALSAIHYKWLEPHDEHVDRHNAAKISEKILKIDWVGEQWCPTNSLRDENFFKLFTQLRNMLAGHPSLIKAVQHKIHFQKTDKRKMHTGPYRAGIKARVFLNQEIDWTVVMDGVEPQPHGLNITDCFRPDGKWNSLLMCQLSKVERS